MKNLHNKINKEEQKQKLLESDVKRTTLSFYKYAKIEDPVQFRNFLYALLEKHEVFGRIYIASEGVNAQISVPEEQFEAFKESLYSISFLNKVRLNIAIEDDGKSFYILKIKVRNKIVADGLDDETFNPSDGGVHLDAKKFNELTEDPDTIVVDMRNHYESEVGHFENAITPDVTTFRESLPIIEEMLEDKKEKNIVMYCTGGIRCEKASAWYKHKGFKKVYQLDGGIIEYARKAKELGLPNKFKGKNFVFDDRLGEQINGEVISKCHQCGSPSDQHTNCANDACHLLFIQCESCAEKHDNCCSVLCADFTKLSLEEQIEQRKTAVFNGSKFGKGRYKAHHSKDGLIS